MGDRVQLLKLLGWSSAGGMVGFMAGLLGLGSWLAAVVGFLLATAAIAAFALTTLRGTGWMTSRILAPSGSSTPHRRGFSRADALVKRGRYRDAIAELEAHVHADPDDPEPFIRIARILRDHLHRHEDAIRWLRRARIEARMSEGREAFVYREIVEIYQTRLMDPLRSAPELARMRERFEGTIHGEWAQEELEAVKELIDE